MEPNCVGKADYDAVADAICKGIRIVLKKHSKPAIEQVEATTPEQVKALHYCGKVFGYSAMHIKYRSKSDEDTERTVSRAGIQDEALVGDDSLRGGFRKFMLAGISSAYLIPTADSEKEDEQEEEGNEPSSEGQADSEPGQPAPSRRRTRS